MELKSISFFFFFQLFCTLLGVQAAPVVEERATSYWVSTIPRRGNVAYSNDTSYQIYRNVQSFGAKGDGVTDDTAAINAAISSGNRCGLGCDSSTITPAIVYFPPGTYMVSAPLIQYYYTQMIGDALDRPTIKALPSFAGIALIDSDPYTDQGVNWYVNQNNFYRQIRNFIIDLTGLPMTTGAGIHWQVAQATSLQNIVFNMVRGGGSANKQQGIFMDNGSGGFMVDLTFNGGGYCMFLGNQQFTTRNLNFNGCYTAIFMNWNWLWSFKSLNIDSCSVGIDMANGGNNQTVGSVLVQDSTISNTPIGVNTSFSQTSIPNTGGSLLLDNVNFENSASAVHNGVTGATILSGNQVVKSWAQGREYTGSTGTRIQQSITAPYKPSGLLDSTGKVFERVKPQYSTVPVADFISVKSKGAVGDGVTDDTQAIQNALNGLQSGQILYFDHGAYVISDTVHVPNGAKITGEIWPLIMAKGSAFQSQASPRPVFAVGNPGEVGSAEISELIFETIGPQPGAILLQWNLAGASQGATGMWDVHFRIGGSDGTQLQSNTCAKDPAQIAPPNPNCIGAFMLFHVAKTASVYVENSWFWVADHELDLADHGQINIFNGRGVLIESTKPTWFYGTSSEHSVLYQYQLYGAKNVYMSLIQTETPYFQSNPDATVPFSPHAGIRDPNFHYCASGDELCKKAWGLKISDSQDILMYGGGLYSFFQNYAQQCVDTQSCQENIVHVLNSQSTNLFGLSTKASINMLTVDGVGQIKDADNRNNFCSTVIRWSG